jgi:hypothetical protein
MCLNEDFRAKMQNIPVTLLVSKTRISEWYTTFPTLSPPPSPLSLCIYSSTFVSSNVLMYLEIQKIEPVQPCHANDQKRFQICEGNIIYDN